LGAGHGGDINLSVGRLTLTGDARISSRSLSAGPAGAVTITATDSVTISARRSADEASDDASGIYSNLFGSGNGGRIAISAPVLTVNEGIITTFAGSESTGRAGDIELHVGRLTLTGGAIIDGSSFGTGPGGTVTVQAKDSVAISGRNNSDGIPSGLTSVVTGNGEGGRVTIATPTLLLDDGGAIATGTSGAGRAGDIELHVGQLALTGGAIIDSGTVSTGAAGTVTISATDSVALSGRDGAGEPSRIFSNARSSGAGGRITIAAPTLVMDDGVITTFTEGSGWAGDIELGLGRLTLTGGAVIDSSTRRTGRGGNVIVAATDTITIAGHDRDGFPSGIFSGTDGRGPGGDIRVAAPHIQLSDGGIISANSTSNGPAGTLLLQAGETFRSERGAVTTEAAQAGGGAIVLRAGRLVQLMDSEVTTTVRGGGGDAGNLTLTAPSVVADHSSIIANAFGGRGGNIQITADAFLADPASLVSASSALGIQGTVDIQAPVTALSGALAPLPQAFVQVAALLPARCAARYSGGQASSLVLGGRPGLPADPGSMLPSPLALEERLAADPTIPERPHQPPSAARFAFLADHERGLPRLAGECAD
jgi:large exoprotein involved in heme utilization and adhesion